MNHQIQQGLLVCVFVCVTVFEHLLVCVCEGVHTYVYNCVYMHALGVLTFVYPYTMYVTVYAFVHVIVCVCACVCMRMSLPYRCAA